jgi:hypothetical protein
MTNDEFGEELVRRLNALDDDEKEALLKLYKHHVVMPENLQMDVDRLLQRLGGASKRGTPQVAPVFKEGEFAGWVWCKL